MLFLQTLVKPCEGKLMATKNNFSITEKDLSKLNNKYLIHYL